MDGPAARQVMPKHHPLLAGFLLPPCTIMERQLMGYFIVFVGAGIGGAFRHATNLLAARLFGLAFPVGTLAVNILRGFAMAIIIEVLALKAGMPQPARLFLATGVLGGFTTFSTFTLDAIGLFERGEGLIAVAYILLSVVGSLVAFFAGMALIRAFSGSLA
jgi:CrcB protein